MVRQYFHKGLLWRASDLEEVQSFELFVDLLYVGIIDVIGEMAAEHPDGFGLLKFIITFTIGWKMWSDLTLVISWFGEYFLSRTYNLSQTLIAVYHRNRYRLHEFAIIRQTDKLQMISFNAFGLCFSSYAYLAIP